MTDLLPVRSDLCHGPSCTEKITATSPSQDFHSPECQRRWHARWAGLPVDQDVEPATGVRYEDLFASLNLADRAPHQPFSEPCASRSKCNTAGHFHVGYLHPSETFASLIPDEPPTPKRTGALPALWAWLRGKR